MKPSAPKPLLVVTDHAVVRYCERVLGMDMEGVRRVIHEICEGPSAFGARCVRNGGYRFEMVDGRVTTIAPDHGSAPNRTSRKMSQERIR
ncbi:MAG: hypothetical protein JWQ01_4920 [Massilia sp.]|nr:hypothetical protein [Massilia sp.]